MLGAGTDGRAGSCGRGHNSGESEAATMSDIGWMLEVVCFHERGVPQDNPTAKFTHVGYMDAHFRTKRDACSYYARHNPHMRAIDVDPGLKSDWDPRTHLAYIVRRGIAGLHTTVPPFDPEDSSTTAWKWLK